MSAKYVVDTNYKVCVCVCLLVTVEILDKHDLKWFLIMNDLNPYGYIDGHIFSLQVIVVVNI